LSFREGIRTTFSLPATNFSLFFSFFFLIFAHVQLLFRTGWIYIQRR
jgi:hypothetical protein